MQPHHLATLRELRDRGSVTAVATALHLSPSAVSQQLATLQRRTPVALTRKEGRSLVLTHAGHRLVEAGEEVFNALARCDEVLHDLTQRTSDPVHISAFHSAAQAFFPELAADPTLDVRLHDRDVPVPSFLTLAGDMDIVVAHRTPADPPWPTDSVTITRLLDEPMDIAVRTGHPATFRELNADVLADLEWITVHDDYPLATYTNSMAAYCGHELNIAHRINDFPTVLAVLARTDCAALLPRHTHPSLDSAVTLLPLPGLPLVRHVDALTRTDRLARASVRRTLARLRDLASAREGLSLSGPTQAPEEHGAEHVAEDHWSVKETGPISTRT